MIGQVDFDDLVKILNSIDPFVIATFRQFVELE